MSPEKRRDYSAIFQPIKIENVRIKNRIAMAPMNMLYTDPEHYPSRQQMAYYAARAKGGTGLIIVEATMATARDWAQTYAKYNNLSIATGKYVPHMANLAEHIHSFGARTFLQIAVSAGRQGSSEDGSPQPHGPSPIPWEIHPEYLIKSFDARRVLRALGYHGEIPEDIEEALALAREVPGSHMGGEMPREITVEEIHELTHDIGVAAKNAKIAGFDGVEIHAPHGYLVHSFLSSRSNKRTDEYGGTFENKIRILIEFLHSCRKKVGPDYPVGVRISASENLPGGFDPHFINRVAKRCEEEGADYIHLSDGSYECFSDFLPNKEGQVIEKAAIIKKGLNIPLICPSVHDPDNVVDVLTNGKADMVSQGRQQIADPEWVNKVKEGKIKDIVRCIRCNMGCVLRFMLALPVRCILNPTVGQEEFIDEYMKRPIIPIKKRVWQILQQIGREPRKPLTAGLR